MFALAFLGWYHSFCKLAYAGLTLWPLKAYVCHKLQANTGFLFGYTNVYSISCSND